MDTKSFVFLVILLSCCKSGLAIYFSQPGSLSLSLGFRQENSTIHIVRAILEPDDSGYILYNISPKSHNLNCPDLSIHPKFGSVSILSSIRRNNDTDSWKRESADCQYKVVAVLKGKPGSRGVSRDEMKLTLNMTSITSNIADQDCSLLSSETLCFEGFDAMNIAVMENTEPLSLVNLGSYNSTCGNFHMNYLITSDALSIKENRGEGQNTFSIWTQRSFDRELKQSYEFSIACRLTSMDDSGVHDVVIPGTLTILDQNDNPIAAQDGSQHVTVFISLSQQGNKFESGARLNPADHDDLLSKDSDTLEVNKFVMRKLNDTKGILDFVLVSYTYSMGNVSSSAVLTRIKLSEKVKETLPWEGLYCVDADLNDTTLVIPHPPMRYTVCLHWGQYNVSIVSEISISELESKLSHVRYEGILSRSASPQAMIMYPFPDLVTDYSQLIEGLKFHLTSAQPFNYENRTFVLKDGTNNSTNELPFAVTEKSGILYLVDSSVIRDEEIKGFYIQLFCSSTLKTKIAVNLTVFLDGSSPNETKSCQAEYCSEFSDENSCKSNCGPGSAGNCLWRLSPKNDSLDGEEQEKSLNNGLYYPTCSPNLITCPDGKCDELEQKYPHLCPQDCTKEINGFGRLRKHNNGKKYGVEYCPGVCTCHGSQSFICSCGNLPMPLLPDKDQSTEIGSRLNNIAFPTRSDSSDQSPLHHQSITYKTVDHTLGVFETADPQCGTKCITVYASLSVFVTVFIIGIVVCAWKRKTRKKKSAQTVLVSASDLELSNTYGDRDRGGNRILIAETEYNGQGNNGATSNGFIVTNAHFNPDSVFHVESKWQISRNDLLLEHIIGEGEFGRVLKGLMHSTTSVTGAVHVAVKMLKVDHIEGNRSLRQEFMAEFSLLKQLDHPNVIKLLGACTTNGGPPYLVMEYAELGSLRSFLRRCRKVENIVHHGVSEWGESERRPHKRSSADVQEADYVVTPQEVLGFSWQISKGMAYLSDMKMVHRDLAARNILLTKTKVCKISDFGLTRDIYVDDAYRKKSKDRVPVKWLAPECLTDELYTSKSDVWAFGILMWELATMGASPYPGIQTELLYTLLDSGYRMQQPADCTDDVYCVMRKCWAKDPSERPTFHELTGKISGLLESGIEYLQLTVPTVSNPGYDIFLQEQQPQASTSSAVTNTGERPGHVIRRNSSMENLRLIDYEISTNDDTITNPLTTQPKSKHTYINNPSGSQDCVTTTDNVNSSGYESPITLSHG